MKYIYNDGGRSAAGHLGRCGDCVTRAVAIATETHYDEVYRALAEVNASYRSKARASFGKRSARNGIAVRSAAFKRYMRSLGWAYEATMGIGTGCTVHLADGELPMGRLVVQVSHHYCAVIDGVIHDTFNPSQRAATIYPPHTRPEELPKNVRWLENGNGWLYEPKRCVYGYWHKTTNPA